MKNPYQNHPFKSAIIALIYDHFSYRLAKRFEIYLEPELYNKDHEAAQNIRNQIRDGNFVAELHYRSPGGILTYVCDLNSWWTRKQTEYALLKFITDKARAGEIGLDWEESDIKNISKDITSGKYETPDSEIEKYMVKDVVKNES